MGPEEGVDAPELELQAVVSFLMWVLGSGLGFSGRAESGFRD